MLFKYDAGRDQWSQFLTLPPKCVCCCKEDDYEIIVDQRSGQRERSRRNFHSYAMQIDRENNQIIFVKSDGSHLGTYDYHHGTHRELEYLTTSVVDLQTGSLIHRSCRETTKELSYPSMVKANGNMHKVCGPHHAIWDARALEWQSIASCTSWRDVDAEMLDYLGDNFWSQSAVSLVHVPSKKVMLAIGPFSGGKGIWSYRGEFRHWEEMKNDQNESFYFSSGKMRAVLSSDERFVIIAVARGKPFQVLDIGDDDQYRLWESSVTVPHGMKFITKSKGSSKLSKLLVFGWIRRRVTEDFVPLVIKTLISHWCSLEIIHSFNKSKHVNYESHQMISLTNILCSDEL